MILQTSAIDQCCPADDESPDTEHEIEDMPRPCTMQNTGSGQGLRAEMAALREQVAELLVSNAQGATYEFSSEPAPPSYGSEECTPSKSATQADFATVSMVISVQREIHTHIHCVRSHRRADLTRVKRVQHIL